MAATPHQHTPANYLPPRPILDRNLQSAQSHPSRGAQTARPIIAAQKPDDADAALRVNLPSIPPHWRTLEIYKHFHAYGRIERIEIFEAQNRRPRNAYVIFCPPPLSAALRVSGNLTFASGQRNGRSVTIECRLDSVQRRDAEEKKAQAPPLSVRMTGLSAGIMQQEDCMLVLFTAKPMLEVPFEVIANLERGMLEIHFGHYPRGHDKVSRYKLCIKFAQIKLVSELSSDGGEDALLITVEKPPFLFRKLQNVEATHTKAGLYWREEQTWFRQSAMDGIQDRSSATTQLQNDTARFDFGRWLTYRLVFSSEAGDQEAFKSIMKVLVDHNVQLTAMPHPRFTFGNAQDLWAWTAEEQPASREIGTGPSSEVLASQMMAHPLSLLTFGVRYQLEVCLSNGVLSESNMDDAFLRRLAHSDSARITSVLEKVADEKKRIYDPMSIFKLQGTVSVRPKRLPRYCAMIPAAVVTPSTVYFSTPVMETSNRVIRRYEEYGDRFLRVKFTDERYRGKIMVMADLTMSEVLTRVYRTMKNGIRIADRHYEFLAFGNSQFREHGAYFFAPIGSLNAARIREWMGNFSDIDVVAKYASRLGQCFSTTRAVSLRVTLNFIPDVKRNGFCFTDGVGKISPFLAQMIAQEYNLPSSAEDAPSVFQFRLGGYKGVLAVDPTIRGSSIHVRPSQQKFPAQYEGLEICRVSQYSTSNLNVQVILVLDALGVNPTAFKSKMKKALADLQAAMTDEHKATEQLCRNIDFSQTTILLADMIYDGFMSVREPFLISCLQLWRSWMLKYLKEKARIPIEQGAFVIGCVDETATLKGHCSDTRASYGLLTDQTELPEIFLQIADPAQKGRYRVIEGTCILARNPSLHPGDVRVVRAVDVPALRHLKNCVALPQTGDRDLANMCSGGDLDGDDYLVMWDTDLIPPEWKHPAMNYDAPPPRRSNGPVTVDEIAKFYVQHIRSDNLGLIAMAHRYHADYNYGGVRDPKCLELAALHSMAVDYAKTGVPADFPKHLRVRRYPHWAGARGKPTYESKKVLGQLYDMVQRQDFNPAWHLPFDLRVLEAYELSEQILEDARAVKQQYDAAIRRIMAQHGIKTEFEVWTSFVLEHNNEIGDYKFAETLSENVSALKESHQELCCERAGTTAKDREWSKLGPFIAAMYTVAAAEVQAWKAVPQGEGDEDSIEKRGVPFISFPWIFAKELGYIARGQTPPSGFVSSIKRAILPQKVGQVRRQHFDIPDLEIINNHVGATVHGGDLLDFGPAEDVEVSVEASQSGLEEEPAAASLLGDVAPLETTWYSNDKPVTPATASLSGKVILSEADDEMFNDKPASPASPAEAAMVEARVASTNEQLVDVDDKQFAPPAAPGEHSRSSQASLSSSGIVDLLTDDPISEPSAFPNLTGEQKQKEDPAAEKEKEAEQEEEEEEEEEEVGEYVTIDQQPSSLDALLKLVGD
ncbi:hypothetical protein B0A50_05547 [Salinomyces thailandicus]|uniref:RNA-dependent RNA polymerase n=1 Tax=Salinomyces thailandicus TaxID=706561 RepID=A0A4U0TVZ8_9PEZI|nr:hypothetical protein B0A50_05547 [Salinomyces thailandica]